MIALRCSYLLCCLHVCILPVCFFVFFSDFQIVVLQKRNIFKNFFTDINQLIKVYTFYEARDVLKGPLNPNQLVMEQSYSGADSISKFAILL